MGESSPQLLINREKMKRVDKTTYLGVVVDDTLNGKNSMNLLRKRFLGAKQQ